MILHWKILSSQTQAVQNLCDLLSAVEHKIYFEKCIFSKDILKKSVFFSMQWKSTGSNVVFVLQKWIKSQTGLEHYERE